MQVVNLINSKEPCNMGMVIWLKIFGKVAVLGQDLVSVR
jgi:hypothetical protein